MTAREGLDRLLHELAQGPQVRAGRSELTRSATPSRQGLRLADLSPGRPCAAMLTHPGDVAKELANGGRHAAILGPVLKLVRLARHGHLGLADALNGLREDFLGRVAEDRAGGRVEAEREWDRAVQGALALVFPAGTSLEPFPCCSCLLSQLRREARDDRRFTPRGKLGERKVLRYLFFRAERTGSLQVRESQRQIAEAIDVPQPTVNKVLRRLATLGWLTKQKGPRLWSVTGYLLRLPDGDSVTTLSTREPAGRAPAGLLVDNFVTARVHRLFGPKGLGPGPAETFAALNESHTVLRRGRLVAVLPGSPRTALLLNTAHGRRRIPTPTFGPGLTVTQLVATTGKGRRTVQRHLKRMQDRQLVFCREHDGEIRWWRYRFDPDYVAGRDEIPDTAELKALKHDIDRRSFYERLSTPTPGRPTRVTREETTGYRKYIDARTGEPLWTDPTPLQVAQPGLVADEPES